MAKGHNNLNMYAPNKRVSKCVRQKTARKMMNPLIPGDFNTHPSTFLQKWTDPAGIKSVGTQLNLINTTINQLDTIDI